MNDKLMANSTTPPKHAPLLFSPLNINDKVTAPNRIIKSAMSEVMAIEGEHLPTELHYRVYRRWAEGGTGIIVSGNVMIDRKALGEPGNIVLEDASHLDRFEIWVQAVHDVNPDAQFWMQINHPGKQSPKFLSPQPVAPSAVALGKGLESSFAKPRALEVSEIQELIQRFANTARLAKQAGFDGVQIHGAHGYLISQFLSAKHNQRTDEWGGSLECRRRFVLEVYRAMRAQVGINFPISIKMNSTDFQKEGFQEDEAYVLIDELSGEGIDLIEISGGNYESPAMMGAGHSKRDREAYFLEFSENAKSRSTVPIAVTGGFRSVAEMERALSIGAADIIGIARPLALDPDLPKNAASNPQYVQNVQRPTTGIRFVDRMFMIPVTFYEAQMRRMGRGKDPDPNMSAWRVFLEIARDVGMSAFKKRRA